MVCDRRHGTPIMVLPTRTKMIWPLYKNSFYIIPLTMYKVNMLFPAGSAPVFRRGLTFFVMRLYFKQGRGFAHKAYDFAVLFLVNVGGIDSMLFLF